MGIGLGIAVSVGMGLWARTGLGDLIDPRETRFLVDPLIAGIALASALFVVVLLASGAESRGTRRSLLVLPIPTWLLSIALSTPSALALLVVVVVLGPLVTMTIMGLTNYGAVDVTAGTGAAVLLGATVGIAVVAAARLICARLCLMNGLAYPVSLGILVVVASTNVSIAQDRLSSAPAAGTSLQDVVLGWTAAANLVSSGRLVDVAVILVHVGFFALLGLSLMSSGRAPVTEAGGRVVYPWRASGRLPLVRLEFHRLVRTRQIQAVLAAGAVLVLSAFSLLATIEQSDRTSVAYALLLPLGCGIVHLCLLARGRSARHRPYALTLGFSPSRWAAAVVTAAGLLMAGLWMVLAAGLAAVAQEPMVVPISLGLQLFLVATGSIVGAALLPGPENLGGEILGLVLVAALATGSAQILGQLLGEGTPLGASLLLGTIGLCLLPVPGRIESVRWRADIANPGHRDVLAQS